jgi:hypothetical protein
MRDKMSDFVMHIQKQTCANCGCSHSYSHTYRLEASPRGRRLHPVRSKSEIVGGVVPVTMPEQTVPVCFCCVESMPLTDSEEHNRWKETLRRKAASEESNNTTSAASTSSIDDL